MPGTVTDLDEERTEREDTDPQIRLDRLRIQAHAQRLSAVKKQLDAMMTILRAAAKQVGALEG